MLVKVLKEIKAKYLCLDIAVRYGEEDMPNDFPLRDGDSWKATVDLDSHKISNWPVGVTGSFNDMKVCDQGTYMLMTESGETIVKLEDSYVPNSLLPGDYGDYISLEIAEDGTITNWLANADLSDFNQDSEDN